MTAPLPDYYILRVKDVQELTGTKKHFATKLLNDIREWVSEIKKFPFQYVTYLHYTHYFALVEPKIHENDKKG